MFKRVDDDNSPNNFEQISTEMEKISKNIEEQYDIINKIERGIRRKKIEHISFLETTSLEFPPISNISLIFPISKQDRSKAVHSIHTPPPNRKIQAELEHILSKHNIHLKENSFNRIIFTNPMKTKMTFDTTFRSSFLQSIDKPLNINRYRSLSKTKLSLKSKQGEKTSLSSKKPEKIKISLIPPDLQTITPRLEHKKPLFSNIMDQPKETQQKLQLTLRQTRLSVPRQKKTVQRYSPWGNPENNQELII